MFTVLSKITFVQSPTTDFKTRTKTIVYNFCHDYKAKSSWVDLTDDGEITLPKNISFTDEFGNKQSINNIIGGFSVDNSGNPISPLFLRGDKVTIQSGYSYYNKAGNEVNTLQTVFTGYISTVTSKKPFVIKIEDNMFILKQHHATGGNNNFFSGSKYTVEKMLAEMISNAGLDFLTVNTKTTTSLGDFRAEGSICQVLAELSKTYGFKSYFRGNELRCGSEVYFATDDGNLTKGGNPTYWNFDFQQNIISDELEYRRKDDVILSAVCKNTIEEATGKTTKDGTAKTKKVRLEVLITFQNGSDTPTVIVGTKDNPLPPNDGGERHDFTFLNAKTVADLVAQGTPQLKRFYYTGFKGKFTTFGIPFIEFGNYINLVDEVLPERNGRYVVKSVEYKGGVEGLRQDIELEYKINI
ncbi:MAG: hypothetical protein M3Z26_00580 [Bacteroidota bacterium]|nr:hypothetical protein [Bacteroidota bacterium]